MGVEVDDGSDSRLLTAARSCPAWGGGLGMRGGGRVVEGARSGV